MIRWEIGMLAKRSGRRVAWVRNDGTAGGLRDGDARVRPDNGAIPADDKPNWEDVPTIAVALLDVSTRLGCRGQLYIDSGADGYVVRCLSCGGTEVARGRTAGEAVENSLERAASLGEERRRLLGRL